MKQVLLFAFVLIVTIGLLACEHTESVAPDGGDGGGNGGTSVTYSRVQSEIFDVSCAVSGCHLGSGSPHGLDLAAGVSYGLLVGQASGLFPGSTRVIPGDPDNSVLVRLVEGTDGPRMPFFAPDPLDQDLQDLLRDWVAEGALDN